MFFKWTDDSVRLTGRWSRITEPKQDVYRYVQHASEYTAATAPGSSFEIAFRGDRVALVFDRGYRVQPVPHVWVSLDGGPRFEMPVDRYLRVQAKEAGDHVVQVVYKSSMEKMPRWYEPLMSVVCFCGYEAETAGVLPEDSRPLIEFLGDSITEGVSFEPEARDPNGMAVDQFNRPCQDDICGTYGWLTAEKLNMRPMFQAYGAVGLTRIGCGAVPRGGLIFPYVFDGVPYTGEIPDITVVNYGANDFAAPAEEYLMRYAELLDMIHARGEKTRVVCLSPLTGTFAKELKAFTGEWNRTHERKVLFVDSTGWVPPEPIHPLADGHRNAAEKLAPQIAAWL